MIEEAKRKLEKEKNSCIVMDFDYTLTDYSSYSSIGVFSNYLCQEYVLKKKEIDSKIENLDNNNIDEYYQLWSKKIKLLNKYASKKDVNKIVLDNNFILRPELVDLLKYCHNMKIPIYIISSGCKEIIEGGLTNNKIKYDNITVIANSFTKLSDKVVNPRNKKEFFNKKYSFYIQIGDEKTDFFIKDNSYYIEYFNDTAFRALSKYQNKKCIYGLCLYKSKKAFYKTTFQGIKNEIKGYQLVSKYYRVPKIINYNEKIIIYEYVDDFIDKSIYDYLYINHNLCIDYDLIFNQYKESLKHIKYLEEKKLRNDLFYNQRIHMIDKYINNNEYSLYKDMFINIKDKISKVKKLHAFVSQGDPTDTNITTTGMFCDFENGGYNSIIGEIAIFIISILSHGAYIYPKYNSKVYCIKNNKRYKNKVTRRNIELLVKYLELFKNNLNKTILAEIDKYLKYYLCFRIITPIDIDDMDDKDKELIFYELSLFYNSKDFNQTIEIIRGWKYAI